MEANQLPTKPGPYYWLESDVYEWEHIFVMDPGNGHLYGHDGVVATSLHAWEQDYGAVGQWLPIPTAEELVELQAAKKMVDDDGFWQWAVYNKEMSMVGRMKPRDKLIENIIDIVHATHGTPNDEKVAHFVKLLVATLKTHFAIGKWVPVSERLPDTRNRTYWDGLVMHDGTVDTGTFGEEGSFRPEFANITHWLELDTPEVEP